jgi:hypothetical protein
MVDCSVIGNCHENGLKSKAYIENVRVSSDGFLTLTEASGVIESGSIIKNAKVWGRKGFGFRPTGFNGTTNSYATLIDCEFFGYFGFSGWTNIPAGLMRGSMVRCKGLSLQNTIRIEDTALLDDCDFSQSISTQDVIFIYNNALGNAIIRNCRITRIGAVDPTYWGISTSYLLEVEISFCTFRNCKVFATNVLGTGYNVEI